MDRLTGENKLCNKCLKNLESYNLYVSNKVSKHACSLMAINEDY